MGFDDETYDARYGQKQASAQITVNPQRDIRLPGKMVTVSKSLWTPEDPQKLMREFFENQRTGSHLFFG